MPAAWRQLTVYEQNVERASRTELWAPGEEVRLTWSPDHSFVVHDDPVAVSNDAALATRARGDPHDR